MRLPGLTYDSPLVFSFRRRVALKVLPPLLSVVIKGLFGLCRFEVGEKARLEDILGEYGHVILAIWHESTAFSVKVFSGSNFHALASYSYDGELGARVIARFGVESVRGSSSCGGSEALQQLAKAVRLVPCVGFTLDGPRGPRRVAKPGVAVLAARTGVPIVPVALTPSSAWRLRSWDRFPIPKPGARIVLGIGAPIPPPADTSRESIEMTRLATENALNRLHATLEEGLQGNG